MEETLNNRGPRTTSTIKDVAKRAGVAFSTASYVLNNKPKSIGSDARERVRAAAQELGYRPNPAARSLVTKRTHIIALWVPNVASAFSARVIAEVQSQARLHGYEMLISEIQMDDGMSGVDHAGPLVANVRQSLWHVDGVITYLGLACRRVHLDALPVRQVPVVNLGTFPLDGADFVGVDLAPGSHAAVRQLVESGCRRIAYLVPAQADFPGDSRREAYLDVVREAGLEPQTIVVRQDVHSETRAAARAAVADALKQSEAMDGLFCFNDECAIGAYRALRDAGLGIPEDVSLIGCNGIEDTKYLDCPLSTLVLPVKEMCATAWNFLEQRIEAPEMPLQEVMLPVHLALRESVRSR